MKIVSVASLDGDRTIRTIMDVSMGSPPRTSPRGCKSVSYVGLVGRKRAHSPEWSSIQNSHQASCPWRGYVRVGASIHKTAQQGQQFSLGIDWDSFPRDREGSDDSGPDVKRMRRGSSSSNFSSRGWTPSIISSSYCQTQRFLGSDEMDVSSNLKFPPTCA